MKSNSLKISVVTICYNAAKEIENTILSVINQTYDNIEYIIIDGGSKDGTIDIIKKYSDKIDYFISEPDNGIYDAMNKGIAVASGEYINFMNAGDSFYSNTTVEEIFGKNDITADIIYGDAIFVYPHGKLLVKPRNIEVIRMRSVIFHQSSFTKAKILKDNKFDTTFKIAGDYNFFFQQYIAGRQFHYIPIPMSYFDAYGVSSTNISLKYKENVRVNGMVVDVKFKMRVCKELIKFRLKTIMHRIAPGLTNWLQFKNLSKDKRISIIEQK